MDLAFESVFYPPQRRRHWGVNIKGGKKMISERTLRKWRKEALEFKDNVRTMGAQAEPVIELCNHILKMTQELLDQHLLRRKG